MMGVTVTANGEWVDRLLELFFAVDRCVKLGNREHLPVIVAEAYDEAEKARQEL